jgi:sulfur carrier protein ThiS
MKTAAASVTLCLPGVLKMVVGTDRIAVQGNTVPEALRSAFAQHPQLEAHLLLESGELRPHILCVVNGQCLLREEVGRFDLKEGDEILIHQAISGG